MSNTRKWELCSRWLAACLKIGWSKSSLDSLEKIWWKNEGWKFWNGQY